MKKVKPIKQLDATIRVPGSKSFTQRALIAASLAEGESVLAHALLSEDTEHVMKALTQLGAGVQRKGSDITVRGTGGKLAAPSEPIYLGNNGTGLRLLTGTVCLGEGSYVIDGNGRMRERPIQPLVDALRCLGVEAACMKGNGCPPVEVRAKGLAGGRTEMAGGLSSQYLSSLLLAAPYARNDTQISVVGPLVSQPYVQMTLDVMADFGVRVSVAEEKQFLVRGSQRYVAREYPVEGDASSATYFMAAAAICGGRIRISNINPDSLQGDLRFSAILETMGCKIAKAAEGLEITGPLSNHADLSFDLHDVPDMVPALAIVSGFRRGKTALKNIGHLRIKECDRISALTNELRKIGARVEEQSDEMVVQGVAEQGAEIDCYSDHRIAMSFAIAGLAIEGIVIKDPDCVRKSFPDFWETLASLG